MRPRKSGKGRFPPRQTVAVVSSLPELRRAARLRQLPDLFELRLDALCHTTHELEAGLGRLRSPVIMTARHSREGGHNNLTTAQRRALLLRFLPRAAYMDVELRSVSGLRAVLDEAGRLQVRRILSIHNFGRTPSIRQIERLSARALAASADVMKLVTRVDTPRDLERVIAGFELLKRTLPTSAMGVGALGRESRVELLARGSALNYAHLGDAQTDGQLSLTELLRLRGAR